MGRSRRVLSTIVRCVCCHTPLVKEEIGYNSYSTGNSCKGVCYLLSCESYDMFLLRLYSASSYSVGSSLAAVRRGPSVPFNQHVSLEQATMTHQLESAIDVDVTA